MGKFLNFKMTGAEATIAAYARLGKLPQKTVSKAAGKGMTVVRRYVKTEAPELTGTLKRSIMRNGERSRYAGKKIFDLTFNPAMNDLLQKPIKNPGEAGGKSRHAYYPASMEFGFLTRSKGGGLSYVPGYHFMSEGAVEAAPQAKSAMTDTLIAEIDKEWGKK